MLRSGIARTFGVLVILTTVGCRTSNTDAVSKDVYYLHDGPIDLSSRPEFALANQVQALEDYKREREMQRATMARDEEEE